METLIKESAPTTTAAVRYGTAPTTNPDLFAFSSAMLVVFAMVAVMAVVGAVADWAARQHPALRLREASSRRRVTHGALVAVLVLFGPAN